MMNVEIRISASITQRDGYCVVNTIARQELVIAGEYDLGDAGYELEHRGQNLLVETRARADQYDQQQKKAKAVAT